METLNYKIIGYTKKNLSPILFVGFADYGDFRNGAKLVLSLNSMEFYRPFKYGEEFFSPDNLPENAMWALDKKIELSEKAVSIVKKINTEYSSQSHSLSMYIDTHFDYHQKITRLQTHNIELPCEFCKDYYPMCKALEFFNENNKLQKDVFLLKDRLTEVKKSYELLRVAVFNKFFVGKKAKTR